MQVLTEAEIEMQVLTEAEIARLLTAYRELEAEATPAEHEWWALSRRLVEVALGTALRRGELLALRWRDVELLEGRLHVRKALVRGEFTTPKSRASRRTLELGPRMAATLQEQWQASRYRADDSVVFCHPALGTPLDPSKLTRCYLRPALKAGGDHQAVPSLARPPPHGAHARGGRREPAGICAAQGRPLAGLHHRAISTRPRCCSRAPRPAARSACSECRTAITRRGCRSRLCSMRAASCSGGSP